MFGYDSMGGEILHNFEIEWVFLFFRKQKFLGYVEIKYSGF